MLSIFRIKYKPTQQETQFLDIIEKLLAHPKTSVKTSGHTNKYFLINEKKHYYVLLQPNVVQITNSKFSLIKNVHHRAYDMMVDKVEKYITINRQQLEDKLFVNETKILSGVIDNLED